jgi:hypothetical protein
MVVKIVLDHYYADGSGWCSLIGVAGAVSIMALQYRRADRLALARLKTYPGL